MMTAAQEVLVRLGNPPSPAGIARICRLSEGLTHFQYKHRWAWALYLPAIASVLELHVHVAKVERPTLPQILNRAQG